MTEITLPWPAKELSPNARVHFQVKAKAAKAYREAAYWLTVTHGEYRMAPGLLPDGPVHLILTFSPPDKRRRDLDGMLSSIKAGLDGVADALAVNDHRFEFTLRRAEPVKGGKVTVAIQ